MGLMTTDSGIFQCFASNPAGNIQSAASLKVVTNPGTFHTDSLWLFTCLRLNVVNLNNNYWIFEILFIKKHTRKVRTCI